MLCGRRGPHTGAVEGDLQAHEGKAAVPLLRHGIPGMLWVPPFSGLLAVLSPFTSQGSAFGYLGLHRSLHVHCCINAQRSPVASQSQILQALQSQRQSFVYSLAINVAWRAGLCERGLHTGRPGDPGVPGGRPPHGLLAVVRQEHGPLRPAHRLLLPHHRQPR